MARVFIELFGVPRLRAGTGRVATDARDVGEALAALGREHSVLLGPVIASEGRVQPSYRLSLNGERFVSDPSTPLEEGDTLILVAADMGG